MCLTLLTLGNTTSSSLHLMCLTLLTLGNTTSSSLHLVCLTLLTLGNTTQLLSAPRVSHAADTGEHDPAPLCTSCVSRC
ncbi:hypothetical protein CesoFtcFv8_025104 [Champsocephalus esox]|uniref:Uncharacterized protein n=1 Tax=Champsocephalus esox TaxID=159716 RepID=A0AAN8B374_9TELE|nr:hypothetical protein CesoFtcFv8_025104 [Champsocephalus esox]